MMDTLKKMNPDGIEDLGVANALFRPSSIKFIDHYANRKAGLEPIEYLHPDLELILSDTYGIWVFQEQMISLAKLSGMRSPDTIRKAIGKKNFALMEKSKDELFDGLRDRGWNEEQLAVLWQDMIDYSSYSFNKSHSSAYAIIAFQMAKLKTYHPKEFMVALLNSVITERKDVAIYINECFKMGINILPPDINKSSGLFKIEGDSIRFGLIGVKGIGQPTVNIIERAKVTLQKTIKQVEFTSAKEFHDTVKLDFIESETVDSQGNTIFTSEMIPKDAMINLIKAGAFGLNRNEMLKEFAESTYEPLIYKERKTLPQKADFKKVEIDISEEDYKDKEKRMKIFIDYKYKEYVKKDSIRKKKHVDEFAEKYISNQKFYDFDTMGCYISMSPFEPYLNKLTDMYEFPDGESKIFIMGTILSKEVKKASRGGQFAKISIVSPFGVYQGKCYSSQYIEYKDIIEKGETIVALVKRSKDEFIISKMQTFKAWKDNIAKKRELREKREARELRRKEANAK